MPRTGIIALLTGLAVVLSATTGSSAQPDHPQRNVIVFVADGLRPCSVGTNDAPTMDRLRARGVGFANSHAVVPTFTMPNASALATGHYPGDDGDYANALYVGALLFETGNFEKKPASSVAFIENDQILGDLDGHFHGNVLHEESLLALARAHGYSTAAIGKLGPVALQDVSQFEPVDKKFKVPETIIIDDATGPNGVPLPDDVAKALEAAGLPSTVSPRVQPTGTNKIPGTRSANWWQQSYFIQAATRVVLPLVGKKRHPFLMVYWSRDPDGTQHNQGDSLNRLAPGINGATSRAGVRNADDDLRQILEYLRANPEIGKNTDVIVTADHGFATISKHEVDAAHRPTSSYAAGRRYRDVEPGFLPPGFLAIDLASFLREPLYDPDDLVDDSGKTGYRRIVIEGPPDGEIKHPKLGDGFIGGTGAMAEPTDAKAIVAAGGGTDLVYVPDHDAERVRAIVAFLSRQDYVGALFVDDAFGKLPGALPSSSIALLGHSNLPEPAVVVGFKTFVLDPGEANSRDPLCNGVQIADTALQQGQGMHGAFSRDNTFNFMAAIGPDFNGHVDRAPVSNADVVPTLAGILGWRLPGNDPLVGRALAEVAGSHPNPVSWERCLAMSEPADDGRRTILKFQRVGKEVYVDEAALRKPEAGEAAGCHPEK